MKKTKFLPYLLKRAFYWFITLLITVAIIGALRMFWQESLCRDKNCDKNCGKPWHPTYMHICKGG